LRALQVSNQGEEVGGRDSQSFYNNFLQ